MKKVYVLLTRTTTMFSKLINSITKDKYTHASIGLDRHFEKLYSFGRRHKNFPLLCGFTEEKPVQTGCSGSWHADLAAIGQTLVGIHCEYNPIRNLVTQSIISIM